MSDFIETLCAQVEACARSGTALRPQGAGSKHFYGGPLQGEALDMRAHSGILEYEPTELVITAKAGTPLAEIEAALAENRQELAFEPPRFSAESTLGGTICAGLSGPGRLARGPVKDYVLGCTVVDGKGQLLHFGGTVMKNVAGYDVSRMLPGSMGTLCIAVDLSIKVMPLAPAGATLRFDFNQNEAISQINTWLGQPLPISASAWENGVLWVRLRGAQAAVTAAIQTMGGEVVAEEVASAYWLSLRDQTHGFFKTSADIWRLAVPPTTHDLGLEGDMLVEWAGGQRWLKAEPGLSADMIRGAASRAGGHATLYRTESSDARLNAFQMPSAAMLTLQRRLKQELDPVGILSPQRIAPIL